MTQQIEAPVTGAAQAKIRAAGAGAWLTRWWVFLRSAAHGEISQWQASVLSRRKFTHPAEVTKMREPVRPNPRATWYR